MPTETRRYLDDKTLVHRLKLEAELRAIQAQTHESRKADLADLERQAATLQQQVEAVAQDRDRLEADGAHDEYVVDDVVHHRHFDIRSF